MRWRAGSQRGVRAPVEITPDAPYARFLAPAGGVERSRREREAHAQARLRAQNEWIEATCESFGVEGMLTFVCECGTPQCAETLPLTRSEYELVRAAPTHFVIAPNYENPDTDVVIGSCPRFSVVAKIEPSTLRIARATDPRQ